MTKLDANLWIDETIIFAFGGKPKTPPPPPPPEKSSAEIIMEETMRRHRLRNAGPGTNILTGAMGDTSAAPVSNSKLLGQ